MTRDSKSNSVDKIYVKTCSTRNNKYAPLALFLLRMLSELFQLVSDISDLLHIKTLGFFLLPPDNIPLNLQHAEARVSCHEELRTLQILPRICKTLADLISIFRFGLLWQLRESETHCRSVFLEDSVRFS